MKKNPAFHLTEKEITFQQDLCSSYLNLRKVQLEAVKRGDFESLQIYSAEENILMTKLAFHNQRYLEFTQKRKKWTVLQQSTIEDFNLFFDSFRFEQKQMTDNLLDHIEPIKNRFSELLNRRKQLSPLRKKSFSSKSPAFVDISC